MELEESYKQSWQWSWLAFFDGVEHADEERSREGTEEYHAPTAQHSKHLRKKWAPQRRSREKS